MSRIQGLRLPAILVQILPLSALDQLSQDQLAICFRVGLDGRDAVLFLFLVAATRAIA